MKKILLCMLCLVVLSSTLFAATAKSSSTVVQMGAVAEMRLAPMLEEKAFEAENGMKAIKDSYYGCGAEIKLSLCRIIQVGGNVTFRQEKSGVKHIAVTPSAGFMLGGNNFNVTAGVAAEALFSGMKTAAGEKIVYTPRNFPLFFKGGINFNFRPFGVALAYYVPTGMGAEELLKWDWNGFKPQWDNGVITAGVLLNF